MADREFFIECFKPVTEQLDRIENILTRMTKKKDILNGDELLDNQDLCELLGVTKRTLMRYRKKGLINYYTIDGKNYYKKSEIQDFFKCFRKGQHYSSI